MYKVYLHTCPDGMYYVGQTRNPLLRWSSKGSYYRNNREFYAAVKKWGWDNISHEILCDCETRNEAESLEKLFTVLLDSENPERGYNKTKWVRGLNKMLDKRKVYKPTESEENELKYIANSENSNPFTAKDLSVQESKSIIDNWIFNKLQREMTVDRFIDGDSIREIAQRHNKSLSQTKRIINDARRIIEDHL